MGSVCFGSLSRGRKEEREGGREGGKERNSTFYGYYLLKGLCDKSLLRHFTISVCLTAFMYRFIKNHYCMT